MASTQVERVASPSSSKLVLAVQISFLPTGVLTTILGPMLPILIARWHLSDTQAGNLFLVQFLVSLLGVQLSGVLLSKIGYRPAFLLGLFLMALGSATLLLGGMWLGMAAVALYGLGLGLIVPTNSLLIAEVTESDSTSAISLLNFFWGVGAVFCSVMVAWAHAHGLLPFFLGSVSLFLLLLAATTWGFSFPHAIARAQSAVPWKEIARHPTFWLFAAVFFFYPGAETAVGGWIGSYVSRLGPQGARLGPIMPAFFWAALTFGRALGTVFLPYLREQRMLRTGYALAAAGMILMLQSTVLAGIIAGALITGLSFATLYPINVARLSQRYGVAARSIGAVMFSMASVGPAVIPKLVGVISQATGSLRAGLGLPMAATLLLFLIYLREW